MRWIYVSRSPRSILGSATPLIESGSGSPGTSNLGSRQDHVHPAAASTGPTLYQTFLTSDVNLVNANQAYLILSLAVPAGTYIIEAFMLANIASLSAGFRYQFNGRIWLSTASVGSPIYQSSVEIWNDTGASTITNRSAPFPMRTGQQQVFSGGTTINMSAYVNNATNGYIVANPKVPNTVLATNKTTFLQALKIA